MAEWWSAEVLDRQDRPTGRHAQITGGSLSWNLDNAVTGSGNLSLSDAISINPYIERIQITHHSGTTATPCDVWVPSISGWSRSGQPVTTTTLALSGKTELLNRQAGRKVTYAAATVVTEAVEQIVRDHGEDRLTVAPLSATLETSLTFAATDAWLTIVNTLLAAINYRPLWADPVGVLHIEPHPDRTPAAVASYGAGGQRMRRDQWSDQAEAWRIPTGVRIIVAGNQTTPGRVGAADLPDEHPLSAVSRGAPHLLTETGQAPSQVIADQIAARRLTEALQIARTVTATHPVDGVELGDVVRHLPRDLTGPIVARRINLGVGAVVEDTIRHTYDGGDLTWL